MTAYRDPRDGSWRYRVVVRLHDGRTMRISGTPPLNTKLSAERAQREHVERTIKAAVIETYAPGATTRDSVPTLSQWFRGGATGLDEYLGRFWTEYVLGEKDNRPGTRVEKRKVFEQHLEPALGHVRVDEIELGAVNALRAELRAKLNRKGGALSEKTRANILGVLATALRYAEATGVIDRAPPIKIKAVAPPPIECWTFDEYGRLLGAALREGEPWASAILLAGEAGLRVGEVVALEWADLDLVANTITVVRQERQGVTGPPKGGKPRTVPMTARLASHLRGVPRIRVGRVVSRNGESVAEGEARCALYRACRLAGLPERLWHRLRHSFATHAALLGANPLRLQHWLGHSTLNMTLRYIHFAEAHAWPIADEVLTAGAELLHPDRRIIAQLGARAIIEPRANVVPTKRARVATSPNLRPNLVGDAGIEPAPAEPANVAGARRKSAKGE